MARSQDSRVLNRMPGGCSEHCGLPDGVTGKENFIISAEEDLDR